MLRFLINCYYTEKFKVVSKREDAYVSCMAHLLGGIAVKYRIGLPSRPASEDSRLFIFDTLEDCQRFIALEKYGSKPVILRGVAEDVEKAGVITWPNHAVLKAWKSGQYQVEMDYARQAPQGTSLCKSFIPIEVVEE